MSVLGEHPDAIINEKDLQIWNNAAFDNGADSESLNSNNLIKPPSWFVKKPLSINRSSDSFDSINSSFSSKENQIPPGLSKTSGVALHPLHQSKPLKNLPIGLSKSGLPENSEEKTDEEIEIENEINRLFARLEAIRLEKQGKTVAAKFKEPLKNKDSGVKKMEQSGFSTTKIKRRGFSLGPGEIMSATNPRSKQSGTTPIQSTQNRRKSCFWKLEEIEEEGIGFSRGKARQAITSIGSKKPTKKDDLILGSIHPKKLFGEQSVPAKKPLKPGRVIPSRYNQATVTSSLRKKSAMDSIIGKPRGTDGRVKKKWEIPGEIVVPKKLDLDDDYSENGYGDLAGSIDVVVQELVPEMLPRIRAVRCGDEPGRDSGPAKRVAELVGKKSYFGGCVDEERVCQILSFEED
ncbi:hypothetical protein L2E82_15612 [Cichorium intybus]|uniref:Uncharacterized protein n=1 Tax=Cichorium intybus TaxID=13427 RepID=A0ACB9F3B1_CICIN|nr:hypothetical protein L2E82_15612 [Cichorium intybus]